MAPTNNKNLKDVKKWEKPQDGKLRNARALIKGRTYKIQYIYQDLSKWKDESTNSIPMKTIAVFKDFGTFVFYTYLCKDYDNKSADFIAEVNKSIEDGENVRLVYYGSMGNYNITKMLRGNEEVCQDTLEGLRAIEDSERTQVVLKRAHDSASDASPSKLPKKDD